VLDIKLKVSIGIIITFLIIGLFVRILSEKSLAVEQQSEIIFLEEPTYILKNELEKDNEVIGRSYVIDIMLQNIGDKKSEKLIVNISDEEGFSLINYTQLNPGEIKTISFNWATQLNRDQKITANFFPEDINTIWTRYNCGTKSFTIEVDEEGGVSATNTPGFEFIYAIMAVIIITFFIKKKRLY
jgi:hypothetical protein